MFDLVKLELKKSRSSAFYIYCIGKVKIPDYFFSEVFFDLDVKEVSRNKLGIFSLIKFRNQILNDPCLVFYERKKLLRWLLGIDYYEIPFFIDQVVDLSIGRNGIANNYHKNLKSTELRKVRKFGYTYKVKKEPTDLKKIYKTMYVPMMNKRHKGKAEGFLDFKKYFKNGYLLVFQGKIAVGFASLLEENETLVIRRFGVLDASKELYSKGAMAAIYHFLIEHALNSKLHFLSFGYSVPFLDDGVLLYKNKWGARLLHDGRDPTFYFGVGKMSSHMSKLFHGKPLIFIRKNKLGALVFGGEGNKFRVNGISKVVDTTFFQGLDFFSRLR